MADKLKFTFTRNGQTLVVGGNEFGILDYSGIEAAAYEFSVEEQVSGVGSVLKRRGIPSRDISITAEYKKRGDGKSQMRLFLIGFFTPLASGVLTVENAGERRSITYEVERFQYKQTNIHERLQFQLELTCLTPCFQSETRVVPITTLVGGWKWKFSLPFRMRQYGAMEKNIYNSGHMETPVEIYFRGPAVNPAVFNYRTGQYVRLVKALSAEEILYIDTGYDAVSVSVLKTDGAEDGWNYLDYNSEFWKLLPGDNRIVYQTDDDNVKSRGVEIRYRERFLGI